MTKLYLDTSAFLKLYRAEVGSSWLKNFVGGNEVVISRLTIFESANTLARLHRNPIEHLWPRIKRAATHNRYFATFEALVAGVEAALQELKAKPGEGKTLASTILDTWAAKPSPGLSDLSSDNL